MSKIVALIPARSGSVRVKHKNLRQFKGIPLLGLAVRQALLAENVDEVYISTDSPIYAKVAENYGAIVPFLRPEEIASCDSTDYDVFIHFLDWYENKYKELPEMIVQVRPTAPVRHSSSIEKAVLFMKEHPDYDSLRSISIPHQSPYKMWHMNDDFKLSPILDSGIEEGYDKPTQSLPSVFGQDGVVDIVRPETLRKYHSMAGVNVAGFTDHAETWDIDTVSDLQNAEKKYKSKEHYLLINKPLALGGNLSIIQGRLTESEILQNFPNSDWRREFELAREAGYTSIEWIRDSSPNKNNPMWQEDFEPSEIETVSILNGVSVRSICDDYVQMCNWERLTAEQLTLLIDLIIRASKIGAKTIVYPLFCDAEITNRSQLSAFKKHIRVLSSIAAMQGVKIVLELSAPVSSLIAFFEEIQYPNVGFCLDTGNLYAAGVSSIDILDCPKLAKMTWHVHIKDRDTSCNNVVLGEGNVNFNLVLSKLITNGYMGLLVTETSRGGNPYKTAIENKKFLSDVISSI